MLLPVPDPPFMSQKCDFQGYLQSQTLHLQNVLLETGHVWQKLAALAPDPMNFRVSQGLQEYVLVFLVAISANTKIPTK